jgi:hypothetical protein
MVDRNMSPDMIWGNQRKEATEGEKERKSIESADFALHHFTSLHSTNAEETEVNNNGKWQQQRAKENTKIGSYGESLENKAYAA